jgi:ABC-type transport system substrate-binding protein
MKTSPTSSFSRLIDWDSHGNLVPGLAESWHGQRRQQSLYHQAAAESDLQRRLADAEDVAFTLTVLLDPKYDGDTDITLPNCRRRGVQSRKADSVSGLKVIDPLTLQVTTTQPGATTLAKIGGPVLSKAWYGKDISAAISTICAPCTANRWATVLTLRQIYSRPGDSFPCQQPFLPRNAADAALYLPRDQSVDQLPAVPDRRNRLRRLYLAP